MPPPPWPLGEYRPCVGMMVLSRQGLVLCAQRRHNPGSYWQMPQGGIEGRESPIQAAYRELWEEVGIEKCRIRLLAVASRWWRYRLPQGMKKKLWEGRFKGQQQLWTAFGFLGADEHVTLDRTADPEFSRWQWCTMDDALRSVIPFKRDVYRRVAHDLYPRCSGWSEGDSGNS